MRLKRKDMYMGGGKTPMYMGGGQMYGDGGMMYGDGGMMYDEGGKLKMVEKDGKKVPFFLAENGKLTRRGRKEKYNTRPGSAYNPEGEFFNPEKQRFARNVKKTNPNQRYNLMRDIQDQRVMQGVDDMEVTDSDIQQRLNRQAIPKSLLAMIAAGLLGKSAATGRFASLVGMGQGPF